MHNHCFSGTHLSEHQGIRCGVRYGNHLVRSVLGWHHFQEGDARAELQAPKSSRPRTTIHARHAPSISMHMRVTERHAQAACMPAVGLEAQKTFSGADQRMPTARGKSIVSLLSCSEEHSGPTCMKGVFRREMHKRMTCNSTLARGQARRNIPSE